LVDLDTVRDTALIVALAIAGWCGT